MRDRYFCAVIEPSGSSDKYSAFIHRLSPASSQVGLQAQDLVLAPGQTSEQKFRIYLGPQELQIINRVKPEWTAVVHFGTFDLISQLLLQVLEFLQRLVHNWGWAVVLLSVLVYLLLFPLSLKQMRSMKEMQALQPHIDELRKKYKDNPQRMNKEIMELYREHKVNPFGGCLPLLLQLPIFFALYQAIMRSIALKGVQFLWIKDLSEPDRLVLLPVSLPLLGNELNILPILMAIGMFIQQKVSLRAATPAAAEQQKMMLILMPVLFGVIFYHMPAALVLYWFVNSTLMMLYQLRISRAK
jgi:YidC/Oxa1 family membrane protein insertase